jgi:hypothetical protein
MALKNKGVEKAAATPRRKANLGNYFLTITAIFSK